MGHFARKTSTQYWLIFVVQYSLIGLPIIYRYKSNIGIAV